MLDKKNIECPKTHIRLSMLEKWDVSLVFRGKFQVTIGRGHDQAVRCQSMNYPAASSGVSKRKMFILCAASSGELNPQRSIKKVNTKSDLKPNDLIKDD
jgi:hypothetical protein